MRGPVLLKQGPGRLGIGAAAADQHLGRGARNAQLARQRQRVGLGTGSDLPQWSVWIHTPMLGSASDGSGEPVECRTVRRALLIVSLVALVAGCGNSNSLSHQELVTKVSAACANWHKYQSALEDPESPSDVGRYMGDQARMIKELNGALSQLDPGGDDQQDFDAFVAALNGARDLFVQMADAAKADDSARMEATSARFDQAGAKVDTTAKALGVKACAGG